MSQSLTNNFEFKNVIIIFRREFKNYFNTPIGYIFLGIFMMLLFFMLFYITRFWDTGRRTDGFFFWLRIVYIFFVPSITMRLWAEEKKSGTIELLLTLPFNALELIAGKYLSALAFLSIALATTFVFPLTMAFITNVDWVVLMGGYIGALFLGSAYISIGLFISWLTKEQIVAFIVSLMIFFVFFLMGYQPVLQFFGSFNKVMAFLSVSWHFESVAKGLLDTRDILYFVTISGLFMYLNKKSIEKWQGYHLELSSNQGEQK